MLFAAIAIGLACRSTSPLQPLCLYNGTHYQFGDTFPAVGGCATCSCSAGGVICGHSACPPDAGNVDAGVGDTAGDVASPRDARGDRSAATDVAADTESSPPDVATPSCALDHVYRFRNDGGRLAFADSSTLTPPRTHLLARDHFRNAPPNQCVRELPCNVPALVDEAAIQRALEDADVVAALAMTTRPFYGVDTRPSDGQVFIFDRDDGRGFDAGSGNSVPPGIRALANLLLTLQGETAATPMCAGL